MYPSLKFQRTFEGQWDLSALRATHHNAPDKAAWGQNKSRPQEGEFLVAKQ